MRINTVSKLKDLRSGSHFIYKTVEYEKASPKGEFTAITLCGKRLDGTIFVDHYTRVHAQRTRSIERVTPGRIATNLRVGAVHSCPPCAFCNFKGYTGNLTAEDDGTPYFSTGEFAVENDLSTTTVRRMCDRGELKYFYISPSRHRYIIGGQNVCNKN